MRRDVRGSSMFDYIGKYFVKSFFCIVLRIFWIFPIKKNTVIFINEHSHNFSDNLKYLALYMLKREKNIKIVYALKNFDEVRDFPIIPVKIFSIKYFYYALTSSVIVVNAGGISYLPLRKEQLSINTWHGGGPYKKTGADSIASVWYRLQTKKNAENIDYVMSSCRICTKEEAKSLYYNDSQVLNSGSPRVDMFFEDYSIIKNNVYKYFNIKSTKKIILYAPTYRGIFEGYDGVLKNSVLNLDYKKLITAVKNRFGGEWVFAIRLHPRLKNIKICSKDIINMNDYPDVQEILASTDILITDYSSIMWDYSFTKKPCFIFATDLEDYISERGFYMEPSHWPFPISTDNDELVSTIANYDERKYFDKLSQHYIDVGSYEHGNACKVAYEKILNHIYMKMK